MLQVAADFLSRLEKSRLLLPTEFKTLAERFGDGDETPASELAEQLVRDGLLTQFQAERLLQGRSRGFFVGEYKLLEILGTGGMGWLYLAEHRQTGEQVALKVLSERHRHDAGMLARLKLEADVRLDHPNIVKTYMIDLAEGAYDVHYVIMELVEGIGLLELINLQGPVPWRRCADFMSQAAAGLQRAHEAGLVHRDIKPENFLIQHDGVVKLLDFGLSLLEHAADDEFSLAMIFGHDCLGSADYMPPEQWRNSSEVDARADIYSLGCTMYVALTGRFPFPGKTNREKMEGHKRLRPKPIREFAADVPKSLEAIVAKMMAKQPENRFQTARDVQQALTPLAERQPVTFDFAALLSARAAEAKRRLAELYKDQDAITDSRATPAEPAAPATVDTAVQEDTQPLRSAPVPVPVVDPFENLLDRESESPAAEPPPETTQSNQQPYAWLIPLDGGPPIPLTSSRIIIGRNTDCDVRIDWTAVSGRHCELRFEGTWWRIIDLDSKNGVQVNGAMVGAQLIMPGDLLTIAGERHFRISSRPTLEQPRSPRKWRWGIGLALTAVLAALLFWWLLP